MDALDRRLLLISYHFGDPEATGSFRWNAMVRDLVSRGWVFDAVTLAPSGPGSLPDPRSALSGRLQIYSIRVPTWPQRLIGSLVGAARFAARWLRGSRASERPADSGGPRAEGTPVASGKPVSRGEPQRFSRYVESLGWTLGHLGWTWRAVRLGRRLGRRHRYRAVIVSSPPHATQLAGPALSKALGVPYLADYRDPWYFGIRRPTTSLDPVQHLLGRLLEESTMKRAGLVICNTGKAAKAVRRLYSTKLAVAAVPNGYDALPKVERPERDRFRVAYAGHLYPWHDVEALFAACQNFRENTDLTEQQFRVEFMGVEPGDRSLPVLAKAYGLESCLVIHPPASRQEAIALQQAAAVLVVFDHFHGLAVPTKFYDCAQMYGDLLAIGARDGALAETARKIGMRVHEPSDVPDISAALCTAFQRWREYRYICPSDRRGAFDRRHQARRFDRILQGKVRQAA